MEGRRTRFAKGRAGRRLAGSHGKNSTKEIEVSCVSAHDPQLARLADAIAQRVGPQRFHVWFNNSTRLDLRQDGLEIAVPNDFISEWIGKNFTRPIQEAAHEVLGCPLIGALQRACPSCSRSKSADAADGVADITRRASTTVTQLAVAPGDRQVTVGADSLEPSATARPMLATRPSAAAPIDRRAGGDSGQMLPPGRGSGTIWRASSSGRATSSPTTPPSTSPNFPGASTTRCSSTATAGWARPICSRACASNSSSTTRPSAGCT